MPKRTRVLSGAAQDAYFRRVLKTYAALSDEEREQLVQRLRQDVAHIRLRIEADANALASGATAAPLPAEATPSQPALLVTDARPPPVSAGPPFDPYSPNVIVMLRKKGRHAALDALGAIDSIDNLRLLAREQRLSVSSEVSSPAELRAAIIAAAERRIANRLAAAS